MFRPFYAFVGYRYTRAKRQNHFISFISLTSVLGVALGVSVLIMVLSVMNGFNKEIRAEMLSGTPHITLGKVGSPLVDWQALKQQSLAIPGVLGVAPYINGQGMLSAGKTGRVQGAVVKGIDRAEIDAVYPLSSRMKEGDLKALAPGQYNIVLGKTLASNLGIELGDKISLIVPEATLTPAGMLPRIKRFTVVGIFEIGSLYDSNYSFINIQDADKLFHMHGGISGLQIKVNDELRAPEVARLLYHSLNQGTAEPQYWVSDWTIEFGSFFKALQIQKTVMIFILLLIIAVAVFNLVSSLVMMVTDKRSDIAIMRAMGASRRSIMGIFVMQGILIGITGTVIGVILGLYMAFHVTAWADALQSFLNVELVAKDVYLVGFLPSEVKVWDVLGVTVVTLVMCLLSTLYPAFRAAAVLPAEALRYE